MCWSMVDGRLTKPFTIWFGETNKRKLESHFCAEDEMVTFGAAAIKDGIPGCLFMASIT